MSFGQHQHSMKQRLIAFFAIVSIFLGIIAPNVSHAMIAKQVPLGMVKVCGANGTTYIPINFAQAKDASQNLNAQLLDSNASGNNSKGKSSCNHCDQHANSYADLIRFNHAFFVDDLAKQSSQSFYRSPVTTLPVSQHNPRGPPHIQL
ncbi:MULTISPECIES: DUF2946 family protein [Methylotenera]|uniref:DUF2946 family protein n=1 Tax=Methylotenera TaxID=359407 RepID=UPI000375DD70|nr:MULTISPECIES: DUF2946 family protein [Methylotenera]